MRRRLRRGISEVVGVLLMLSIVVGMGVLVFAFASGGMGTLSEDYAALMSGNKNTEAESFKVQQVAFVFPNLPAIDGTATNEVAGASSSIAASALTTSRSSDVIIAYVSPAVTSGSVPSVSGISGGGLTWNHRISTSSETYTYDYVSITVTNSQTTATPNPFQQQVTWDPATFAAYESSTLGNIRFCADTLCTNPLYSWLQSCTSSCGTGATSATAWVRLTSAIGASSSTTIYMVFQPTTTNFDGVYWGEAPTLSASYAQYDNGANVFTFYDNFAGTTLSSKWTTVEAGSTVTVSNGVTFAVGASTADYAFIIAATAAYPYVAETDMVSISSNSADPTMGVTTTTSTNTGVDPYIGYALDDIPNTLTLASNTATASTEIADNTGEGFAAGIWDMIWSATGHESASDGTAAPLTGTSSTNTIANYGIFVGQSNNVGSTSNVVQWARDRAYPPAGVMPTATPASSASTASITFDEEEWYAISSSTLSSVTITATLSASDSAGTWISVFGVSGTNTASPFDPNPSVPKANAGTSPSTTMSTTNGDDILLYGCAAGEGSVAAGFTTIYSNAYISGQSQYVGYEQVSTAQSGLVTSCGTNSYGAEITDALTPPAGADVFVRNFGSNPTTLVSVYITDTTSDALISQTTISDTVNVGNFVEIPYTTLGFTPTLYHSYTFVVSSSLGNSQVYDVEAT